MNHRWKAVIAVLSLALAVLVACAVNPVSGKKELMLFSEKQEIAMGMDVDKEINGQFGLYASSRLDDYVNRVGRRLVPHTHRPGLAYHFAVLDSPVVNAFAAPGGYIYVTRGILALMNSEAELAVVLGHELGHVNARHSMKRLSGQMLATIGLVLGSVLNKNVARIAGVAGIGFQLLFLKYSRDDEYQADELGLLYSRQAGYNPREMVRFFSSLEQMSEESGGNSLPNFLSTHPLTKKRIERAESLVQPGDAALARNPDAYFGEIDGLVFGENPRQGFVEGGVFYHPDMAFQLLVPGGWQVQNTPQQLVMAEKDGKAALQLQAEASGQDLDAYLDARAKNLANATSLGRLAMAINGLQAVQAAYRLPQEDGSQLLTQLTCVRIGRFVVSMLAAAPENQFDAFADDFRRSVRSFASLTDRDKLARRSLRLRVVRAGGRESLQEMLRRAGVAPSLWKTLALYNGRALDSIPSAGERVKMVDSGLT